MTGDRPLVRVGIVSWNTADELDRCLSCLPAALDGLDAEIVVVDNASGDDSADRAERHGGVRVIRNGMNEGYARAMNQALAHTSAPVLLALNPDTQAPAGSLRRLVETLLSESNVGLVVPQLRNDDGSLQHSVNRFPSVRLTLAASLLPSSWHSRHERRWWIPGIATHEISEDIDWAIGAVHVIRATALGGTPPYSERWFMYVEDLDLCWRLDRAGWRRRLDSAVWVGHTGNVAGAQAWGADPALRWMPCSYDFYSLAHSNQAARVWAAANALALFLWSLIGLIYPGWLVFQGGPGGRKAQARRIWMQRGHMRIHLTVLLVGPKYVARRAGRPGIGGGPELAGPPQ
jgi:GT2 family glycosyltransferase